MKAGITISFTAMEAGITKVITATYPVMLAVLSSSCNEETRTYSEGRACMANQFQEAVIPRLTEVVGRGGVVRGGLVIREIGGGLVRGCCCPGGVVQGELSGG